MDCTLGTRWMGSFPFKYDGIRLFTLYLSTYKSMASSKSTFALPPFISLVFYFYLPYIEAYAGLSGVLHGLYTAVALVYLQYRKERNFALLVLGLIIAKLIWENTFGQTGTAQLIGSPVLTEAHLYGAIGGAIFGGCYWLFQRLKKKH